MTHKYTYVNETGSNKWNQPCTVSVQIHDLDQAHKLAQALQAFADKAAKGGDFGLIGAFCDEEVVEEHIGHDVSMRNVTLTVHHQEGNAK
ncbi:hypothetical protein phiA829_013 [Aeromonas phage phiA8-29]|uniref:Uncharacterized protein n=1 Tax=Aeromonas phage phiA8-29 TaxID=1978922 RepID=A0A1W6DY20_9CAUD|nr:hypothetical protein HWB15_gp014 [Aeromonas phage phiA8-29]ARK07833.1 hypothetical protein phiA829_013 [Aeromonas phage phiA8-29]